MFPGDARFLEPTIGSVCSQGVEINRDVRLDVSIEAGLDLLSNSSDMSIMNIQRGKLEE